MVKGNMGKFEVKSVYSNLEENSCLNACVLLRSCYDVFSNLKTPDLFAKRLAKDKLGGVY